MPDLTQKIEKTLELMGFDKDSLSVKLDEDHKKISLMIDDEAVRGDKAPQILSAFNHILNQMLKSNHGDHYVVDLNYYRKERERLITRLARAAARKASATEEAIELPPMNSYERRLVHVEIKTHPELETESKGKGKERHVVIKKFSEEASVSN